MTFCVQRTTFEQAHFLEVLKDLFKYFGTLMMVINNIMYLIIYLYVNITLLISYICGIVLVELKLLQVLCNRFVNHLFISKQWYQNPNFFF